MFSYEVFKGKGILSELVAAHNGFSNYTEMCIEIGKVMQKDENTSECKNGYYCKVYENGRLIPK